MYLKSLKIKHHDFPVKDQYPFCLEVFQYPQKISFDSSVTFFVGENGTGKSTLLKAIARKCNIHIWEGYEKTQLKYNPHTDNLFKHIELIYKNGDILGSFFGAEIFRHFAELLDEWAKNDPGILKYFGGESLTSQSHGQGNMSFFENRFKIDGLYLLDEPESALSPKSQIELMKIINQAANRGNTQFIIATHSPLLLALRNSTIYSFDRLPIRKALYEETDYFRIYKDFLNNKDHFLEKI
jgi:predicted ATPase